MQSEIVAESKKSQVRESVLGNIFELSVAQLSYSTCPGSLSIIFCNPLMVRWVVWSILHDGLIEPFLVPPTAPPLV